MFSKHNTRCCVNMFYCIMHCVQDERPSCTTWCLEQLFAFSTLVSRAIFTTFRFFYKHILCLTNKQLVVQHCVNRRQCKKLCVHFGLGGCCSLTVNAPLTSDCQSKCTIDWCRKTPSKKPRESGIALCAEVIL